MELIKDNETKSGEFQETSNLAQVAGDIIYDELDRLLEQEEDDIYIPDTDFDSVIDRTIDAIWREAPESIDEESVSSLCTRTHSAVDIDLQYRIPSTFQVEYEIMEMTGTPDTVLDQLNEHIDDCEQLSYLSYSLLRSVSNVYAPNIVRGNQLLHSYGDPIFHFWPQPHGCMIKIVYPDVDDDSLDSYIRFEHDTQHGIVTEFFEFESGYVTQYPPMDPLEMLSMVLCYRGKFSFRTDVFAGLTGYYLHPVARYAGCEIFFSSCRMVMSDGKRGNPNLYMADETSVLFELLRNNPQIVPGTTYEAQSESDSTPVDVEIARSWLGEWLKDDKDHKVFPMFRKLIDWSLPFLSAENYTSLSDKISKFSSDLTIKDMRRLYCDFFLKWESFRKNKYAEQFVRFHCYLVSFIISPSSFSDIQKVSDVSESRFKTLLKARDGLSCCFDCLTYCSHAITEFAVNGSTSGVYDTLVGMNDIDEEFNRVNNLAQACKIGDNHSISMSDREVINDLHEVIDRLRECKSAETGAKREKIASYIRVLTEQLEALNSYINGMKDKTGPFMIRLWGATGVSKSHLTMLLAQILLEANGYSKDPKFIKHINLEELTTFMTAWRNSILCTIMDDADHSVPERDDGADIFRLKAGNNAPHALKGASLQEKGRLFNNALFHLENTNNVSGNAHYHSLFPSAEARRIHYYIECHVKPKYKMQTSDGGVQPRIDYSRVDDPSDPLRDCWGFTIREVEVEERARKWKTEFNDAIPREADDAYRYVLCTFGGKVMKDIDIIELLNFLIVMSLRHFKSQKSVHESNLAVVGANFTCDSCRFIKRSCVCGRHVPRAGTTPEGLSSYWQLRYLKDGHRVLYTREIVDFYTVYIQRMFRGYRVRSKFQKDIDSVMSKYVAAVEMHYSARKSTGQTIHHFLSKYYPKLIDKYAYCASHMYRRPPSWSSAPMRALVDFEMSRAKRGHPSKWCNKIERLRLEAQSESMRILYLKQLTDVVTQYDSLTFKQTVLNCVTSIKDFSDLLAFADKALKSAFTERFASAISVLVSDLLKHARDNGVFDFINWIPADVITSPATVRLLSKHKLVKMLAVADRVCDIIAFMAYNVKTWQFFAICICTIASSFIDTYEYRWAAHFLLYLVNSYHAYSHIDILEVRRQTVTRWVAASFLMRLRTGTRSDFYRVFRDRLVTLWEDAISMIPNFLDGPSQESSRILVRSHVDDRSESFDLFLMVYMPRLISYAISECRLQYVGYTAQSLDDMHKYDKESHRRFMGIEVVPVSTPAKARPSEMPNSLKNNVFAVVAPNGMYCNMLGLCNELALLPRHFVMSHEAETLKAYRNVYDSARPSNSIFTFVINGYNCSHSDHDFTFVKIPNMGSIANITRYLRDDVKADPVKPKDVLAILHRYADGRITGYNDVAPMLAESTSTGQVKYSFKNPKMEVINRTRIGYFYNTMSPTFNGLCGSPVFSMTRKDTFIYGIHIAGGSDADSHSGACIVITRADVADAAALLEVPITGFGSSQGVNYYGKNMVVPALHPQAFLHESIAGNYLAIGYNAAMTTFNPTIIQTPIATKVKEAFGHDWHWDNPYNREPGSGSRFTVKRIFRGIAEQKVVVREDKIEAAKAVLLNQMIRVLPGKSRVLDWTEMVNGVDGSDYMNALPFNTSMGKALSGPKSKYILDMGADKRDFIPCVRQEVEKRRRHLRDGERCMMLFNFIHKDEPTEQAKIDAKKTRGIFACDTSDQLIIRRLFLNIIDEILHARDDLGIMVGINPHSLEWDALARRFHKCNVVELDHANYDLTVSPQITKAVLQILIAYAHHCGFSRGDIAEMETFMYELMYPCINLNGDVVMMIGGIMSGSNLTSIVGSMINIMMFILVYHDVCQEYDLTRNYFSDCTHAVYGDDSVMQGRTNTIRRIMTAGEIIKRAKAYGFELTPGDKGSKILPNIPLSKSKFLKRQFRMDDEGVYVAPLDKKSLLKQLSAIRRPKYVTVEAQVGANMSSVLYEVKFYGKRTYNKWKAILERIAEEEGLVPYFELYKYSYEQLIDAWRYKYKIPRGFFYRYKFDAVLAGIIDKISARLEEEQ